MEEKVTINLSEYVRLIRADQKLLSILAYIDSEEYPNTGIIKTILKGEPECCTTKA